MSLPTSIQWEAEGFPRLNVEVLAYREGGKNNHNDILVAKRVHKYGHSKDINEWHDLVGSGWGISVDGSAITHWAYFPQAPFKKVTD